MCVNYVPPNKRALAEAFNVMVPDDMDWPAETYKDYQALIIVSGASGGRAVMLAGFGMVSMRHIPPNVKSGSARDWRHR